MYLRNFIGLVFYIFIGISVAHGVDIVDDTISQLLQEKINISNISLQPQYHIPKQIKAIKANQDKIEEIIIDDINRQLKQFSAKIKYIDGSYVSIKGKYIMFGDVPIASNFIQVGDIIQEQDIMLSKLKLDNIGKSFALSSDEVVGMQAKQYIAAGSMIKRKDLQRPQIIKKNDPINLVYLTKSIKLQTSGIALGAGAVGENIKVKNSSSGATLLGEIINNNTVKISGH